MTLIDDAIAQYQDEGIAGVLAGARRFAAVRGRRAANSMASKPFDWGGSPPCDVMSEDWDVLVLLDACRQDYFESTCELKGTFESRVSAAGSSKQFLERNFVGRSLHDTVYVTGNPYVDILPDETFHAVHDEPLRDGFDPESGTIPPQAVTDAAIQALDRYPKKTAHHPLHAAAHAAARRGQRRTHRPA